MPENRSYTFEIVYMIGNIPVTQFEVAQSSAELIEIIKGRHPGAVIKSIKCMEHNTIICYG